MSARRYPIGAELLAGGGAHVRVWAPACERVDLIVMADGEAPRRIPMTREPDGHFGAHDPAARAGDRYAFDLGGGRLRPDPASRYQPEGPHAPSMLVDPRAFRWTDAAWRGLAPERQVVYELHIGTFTSEGTWKSAAEELPELARIGITAVEMMPIAEFAGRFGWGYDGVDLYAPYHAYGTPDELRAFVDRAHALGLGIILDVVYNHFGPDGNYLAEFSPDYFTDEHANDWGAAINFEGPPPVRDYFVQNARYWIDEFHLDGLRFDATQDIHDASPEHILTAVVAAARAEAGHRRLFIVAENEPQDTRIVRQHGGDAMWNDDAHHAALVALTGRREAYYRDYEGTAQELIACSRFGYLYQGQWYSWQKKRRGAPALDLPPRAFVTYLENHDQVANSAFGRRLHELAQPGAFRAMTAWLLLGPATPMLFQGQEFSSSRPFQYFADHEGDLAASVREGRREFLSQFPSLRDEAVSTALPAPHDETTFARCKLDRSERARHVASYALHADLLRLRRNDPVLAAAGHTRPEGAVLGPGAFVLRYMDSAHGDRLLVLNLGRELDYVPVREPLLAPPAGAGWRVAWSSEAPAYGGQGTPPLDTAGPWRIPAACALLLVPDNQEPREAWRN